MKRRIWSCLLAVMLLFGTAAAEEVSNSAGKAETDQTGETAIDPVPVLELPELTRGRLVEIPVDQDSMEISIPPKDECYLYGDGGENPTGYADPSLTVNLGWGRIYDTNYVYARVKIASPSQLRTLLASPLKASYTTEGHKLAKRVNAVIAINGDFCGGDDVKRGALMRQGEFLRKRCNGQLDMLVIDKAGDFHLLLNGTEKDVQALEKDAVNIFTFGPALVADGEALYDRTRPNLAPNKPAQRMAICQTGPCEYMMITSEGPEDPGSEGLNIRQFVELVSSFKDVKQAYNLDGGSSSTMVFRKGEDNWKKINAPNNKKIRPLKDIIYFASGWEP